MDFELREIAEKQAYEQLCSLYGKEVVDEVLAKLDLRPVDMVYTDPADPTHIELYAKQGTLPSRIEPYLRFISWNSGLQIMTTLRREIGHLTL